MRAHNMRKILPLHFFLIMSLIIHHTNSGFATNFNCREEKQSAEYIEDVKIFVRETSDYFNNRASSSIDLSELGVGFVRDEKIVANVYAHITSMDLSKNVIKTIDMDFLVKYPNLQTLDLSQNCVKSLGVPHRKIFWKLLSLNVSHNLITSVHPFTFSNLTLNSLDLSHNHLIRFLAADYEINQFHINHNKITQLEIDSSHSRELKLLDASNNRLRIFKVSTNDFDNLLLSNNHLTLNENFSIRNVYGTLDLSKNHIGELDWKLISCVTNLNLSFNRVALFQLQCSKNKFQKIERLNLDGNLMCKFDVIGNLTSCLPNLRYISLLGNKLSEREKVKTKYELTCHKIKSQVFEHEFFTRIEEENGMIDIFSRN